MGNCRLGTARILGVAAVLSFALPAAAQVNRPEYADYFLVGRFGEICTMCEAIVLCQAGDTQPAYASIPAGGTYALYHVQTRTFWSQIATIWEWFIANFDSRSLAAGHSRPIDVYSVADGDWSGPRTLAAQVSLEPPSIVVGEYAIDRVERRWLLGPDARPVGYCQRLPLWQSLEIIDRRAGGDPGT